MKRIACVGILVADVMAKGVDGYPAKGELVRIGSVSVHNGGNAMTAAMNLDRLGTPVSMIGKVGTDLFGDYLADCLDKRGIDVRGLCRDSSVGSSVSIVLLDPSGERSFLHTVGTNGTFAESDVDYSIIAECDAVFLTGIYLMDTLDGDGAVTFLRRCKEMGKTTFVDVCWDATGRWASVIEPAMPYIDYFMPSIDEAVKIAGCTDPDRIADRFNECGARNVVIKMGGKGSYVRLKGEEQGRVFPILSGITPVDTTGAGDSFCSGFIASWSRDLPIDDCMRIANTTGAMCVGAMGATSGIRSFDETLAFLAEHTTK